MSSVAPRQSNFYLYDRILHGQLGPMLTAWRGEDPPASLVEIVVRLRGVGVDVSTESVRRWMAIIEQRAQAS